MMLRRLSRALIVAALVAASLAMVTAASASHTEPTQPNGAALVDECRAATSTTPVGRGTCRGLEQILRVGAQICRFAAVPDAACSGFDGKAYSAAAMDHFEETWVHRALALQSQLDDRTPLLGALIPATHNSNNSAAYYPTLSGLDHNQVASITDQLRMHMRGLEIDLHRFPSPYGDPADGGFAPIMCHGTTVGPVHVGCTGERHMREGLAEIRTWLDANPDEVVLLYLENQLDNDVAMHNAAARTIEAELGSHVYRPASTCADMPTHLSEADIRAAGKQVVIVGNCSTSHAGWGSWVHLRGAKWSEDKSPEGDQFACPPGGYPNTFKRFYEDSTWVSHTVEPSGQGSPGEITAAETARMVECGVNLFGFDQLVPGDPRLEALVWSWAPDEPSAAAKRAYSGADGRFYGDTPGSKRAFACRAAAGWTIATTPGPWGQHKKACGAIPGSTFAVPATGADNAALLQAKQDAGVDEVWVAYANGDAGWAPTS